MKKLYMEPEMEIHNLRLVADVLGPSREEGNIPEEGEDEDGEFDGDLLP